MKKLSFVLLSLICMITCIIGFTACSASDKETYRYEERGEQWVAVFVVDTNISGEVTIPSTYNGKQVTHIGEHAFKNCKKVNSIIIPEGIQHISYYAFAECSVKTLKFPSTLKSIADFAVPTRDTSIYRIDYNGTIAKWKKVEGYSKISYNIHVICTDGEWER